MSAQDNVKAGRRGGGRPFRAVRFTMPTEPAAVAATGGGNRSAGKVTMAEVEHKITAVDKFG